MNLLAQQIKFEDTEGLEFPEGQLITEGDEGESVAAAVAEVTEEEAGIAEDERQMDDLVETEETLTEVQDTVENDAPKMEHAGLTPVGARLAKIVLKKVVGSRYADRTLPKMENFESRADSRTATSFVQEGVGEALKSFWEALKAQFLKLWGRAKTWYVKTFSAAKRVADRAKTVRDRAESANATIDKKSFEFAQVKQLAVGGRLKSVSEFETAFGVVVGLVAEAVEIPTDKAIEDLASNIEIIADGEGTTKASGFNQVVTGLVESFKKIAQGGKVSDAKVASSLGAGAGGEADVNATPELPGDKQFVVVSARDSSDLDKVLRMTRLTMVNTKDKPKEISSKEVATLNASQVAKLASTIAESADDIAEYESKWQKVDKAQDTLIKGLDSIIRNIESDVRDDENSSDKAKAGIRKTASAATQFTQRLANTTSSITGYALTVYAATLNWCEGSMRNYK